MHVLNNTVVNPLVLSNVDNINAVVTASFFDDTTVRLFDSTSINYSAGIPRYNRLLTASIASPSLEPNIYINSGLRVFSKETITPLLPRLSNGFSFSTTSTLSYLLTNKSIVYFEITYLFRKGENNFSKVKIFRDSLRTLQSVFETTIYYNPFKIFLLLSIIFILLSAISLSIFYYLKIKMFVFTFFIFFIVGLLSLLLGFFSSIFKKAD